jgi:hypothetical protein
MATESPGIEGTNHTRSSKMSPGCEEEDGRALADAMSEEGEREASQRNACPESGCDETNFAGVSVAELDEEGDYPS